MPDGSDSDQIDQDSGSGGSNQDSKGTTSATIRLAHFTVKEYLMSDRIRQGPAAFFSLGEEMSHLRIAETCLSCLLLYEMILFVDEGEFTMEFPIAKYSARYWVSHFRKARSILEKRHFEHASELFLDEHKLQNWVALYDIDDAMEICGRYKQGSSLYYAVFTGLYGLVEVVLQSGNYIYANEETSIGRRSVFEAHDHGKTPPCHTNKRTPIDSRGGYLHTPLQAASYYRLSDIVELLLKFGANPNIYGEPLRGPKWRNSILHRLLGLETRSALSASAKNGDTATANVLLDNGADIHEGVPCPPFASTGVSDLGKSNNKTQFVPKNVMLESCPPEYFRLIVDEMGRSFDEADFQTLKGPFYTALFHAAYNGHTEMVNVLLDRGARIDLRNGEDSMTALMEASEQGGDKMVELLLERGAQVDKTDIWGSTAFIRACDAGKESIARLLLERGAQVDKTDIMGETALSGAYVNGNESIARLLLEKGAHGSSLTRVLKSTRPAMCDRRNSF
ncbi:MAG: hypothetical protein Q9196_007306 [Gyalolechia fulgens]